MITDARPITIVPVPILISAKPLNWATREDETAIRPLPSIIPKIRVLSVFTPCALIIFLLSPVARSEKPSSVLKNIHKMKITIVVCFKRGIFD